MYQFSWGILKWSFLIKTITYRTHTIIIRGLYIFYPIFHCGQYYRVIYDAEQLIFHDFFYLTFTKTPSKLHKNGICCSCYICFVATTTKWKIGENKLWFILQSGLYDKKLFCPKNPRFIIKSSFKWRAGYDGMFTELNNVHHVLPF